MGIHTPELDFERLRPSVEVHGDQDSGRELDAQIEALLRESPSDCKGP